VKEEVEKGRFQQLTQPEQAFLMIKYQLLIVSLEQVQKLSYTFQLNFFEEKALL
jgi:hypothetical protein